MQISLPFLYFAPWPEELAAGKSKPKKDGLYPEKTLMRCRHNPFRGFLETILPELPY